MAPNALVSVGAALLRKNGLSTVTKYSPLNGSPAICEHAHMFVGKNRFTGQHFIWELFSITCKGWRGIQPRPMNTYKKQRMPGGKTKTTCSTHELPWKQPGNINNQRETFKGTYVSHLSLPFANSPVQLHPTTAPRSPPSFRFQWVSIRKWHRFGFTLHFCVKSPNYTLSSFPPLPTTHKSWPTWV